MIVEGYYINEDGIIYELTFKFEDIDEMVIFVDIFKSGIETLRSKHHEDYSINNTLDNFEYALRQIYCHGGEVKV